MVDQQIEKLEKMIEEEKVDSEKLEETRKELVAVTVYILHFSEVSL